MPSRIEVVHAASPVCSWSWGYEPVLNRLEMVYGDQVDYTVFHAIPYTDLQQWLKDYEMTEKEALDFEREIADTIGMPMHVPERWADLPASCLPASLACKAAGIVHDAGAERRLMRALMVACFVDQRDTATEEVLVDVSRSLGLDVDAMLEVAGGEAAMKALEEDSYRGGHGANFYSLLVRDNAGTTVTLERAYDPARVESAIDWMTGGTLKKARPTDVAAYVRERAPVPAREIETVFGLAASEAAAQLGALEKAKRLAQYDVAGLKGGTFWKAA